MSATSTVMSNNGVRIDAVNRMLAHSSIRITQQYAKVYDQDLLNETELLSGFLEAGLIVTA
jgi:site-specific recombinase XerD